jgi:hypothetical protein
MPYQLAATAAEPALSEDAAKIMARMTDFISAAPSFSLVSEIGYEVMQDNGQVLEFGSLLTLAIQRPSRAIGRFDSRNGDTSTTVLDGEGISISAVSGPTEKIYVYDTTRQPGDIDSSLEFLARQLNGIYRPNCLTPRSHSPHQRALRAFDSFRILPKRNRSE